MSEYECVFDSNSRHWSSDVDINLLFIHMQQNFWNDMLKARGHVFLNEVLESLGFSHTPVGAVVGWTMSGSGDGEIEFVLDPDFDFGTDDIHIDFNVDGFILDKLGTRSVR